MGQSNVSPIPGGMNPFMMGYQQQMPVMPMMFPGMMGAPRSNSMQGMPMPQMPQQMRRMSQAPQGQMRQAQAPQQYNPYMGNYQSGL